MLTGPELETDERPDALRVIARAALMLIEHRFDFARARPSALRAATVEKHLTRPAD